MEWTEQDISQALGNSRHSLRWSDYGPVLVDLNRGDSPSNRGLGTPWTVDELRALVDMKSKGVTLDLIEDALKRDRSGIQTKWLRRKEWWALVANKNRKPDLSFESILCTVCLVFGVPREAVTGNGRRRAVCEARHVLFWLARKYAGKSSIWIGQHCGLRDHSTVLHGISKVEANMASLQDRIDLCKQELGLA